MVEDSEKAREREPVGSMGSSSEALPTINGVVYNKQRDEQDTYICKVVAKIGEIHRPYVVSDQSFMEGTEALVKVIIGHFDKLVENVNHLEKKACVVGLYGIGGLGKTTLCTSMVNFYYSEYFGRSHQINFPTTPDEKEMVKECKEAMQQLFKLRDEGPKVKKFDYVVGQMKKHVGTSDIFLAIDNIWDHSIEEACKLLGVGFTANSKVLLTSRSKEILWRLLSDTNQENIYYYHIYALPAPNKKDAFKIFQRKVNQGDLSSLLVRYEIEEVLKRCQQGGHDGGYNPLAVRILGGLAAGYLYGQSKKNIDSWAGVLKKLKKAELTGVNNAVRFSYDTLDKDQKHIFIDIAICFSNPSFEPFLKCTLAHVNRWLQFYYKKLDEWDINAHIGKLALAGVIDIKRAQYGEEMIEVHDLYIELAQEEAKRGPRFLTSIKEAVDGLEWGNLKRVILAKPEEELQLHQFEKVQLHQCEKLKLLYVYGIQLEHFPKSIASLRVLILQWPRDFDSKRTSLNLNGFVNLVYLSLENLPSLVKLEGQTGFSNLQMLFLRDCTHVEDLDILRYATQLEVLVIDGYFDYAWMTFKGPEFWKKSWPDLVTALQKYKGSGCMALKSLPDLSPTLKLLNVTGCTALERLPYLGGLTALETLMLHKNTSLAELGAFGPALKTVIITGCPAVTLLDRGSATGLEALIWLRGTDQGSTR